MSTLALLSEHDLDAVTGGLLNFVAAGIIIQTNASNTQQGQFNAALFNAGSSQGGTQVAQTIQQNNVSAH